MKTLFAKDIIAPLCAAIDKSLKNVEPSAAACIKKMRESEDNPLAAWALKQIDDNNILAASTNSYACQDCGQAVLFVSVGQDVHISGSLTEALNLGVEQGYLNARKSVAHPLNRINTKTNTPCIIHYDYVEGDNLKITYLAKGAGSENMSALYMLTPSKGREGIISSVTDCVLKAGANPCPPIIVGVGIGGTAEKAAVLAKFALTRETGTPNIDTEVAKLEKDLLSAVNALNVGAQGFGGKNTALAVHAEVFPTHIGMLPVCVNIQCHSVRHATLIF